MSRVIMPRGIMSVGCQWYNGLQNFVFTLTGFCVEEEFMFTYSIITTDIKQLYLIIKYFFYNIRFTQVIINDTNEQPIISVSNSSENRTFNFYGNIRVFNKF